MRPSTEQAKALADELSALSKEQASALQNAAYIRMTREEADCFDSRAMRIKELCTLLGTYKVL